MKIQKLTLEGFRGFKDKTEFELHPNVNVFVGVNGSGKTSVLDAVGMLLGVCFSSHWSGAGVKVDFLVGDFSIDKHPSPCKISLTFKKRKITDDSISVFMSGALKSDVNNADSSDVLTLSKVNIPSEKEKPNLGAVSKYIMNANLEEVYDSKYILKIYDLDINRHITHSNFNNFVAWYITEENNENRVKLREDANYVSPRLSPIRLALKTFLEKLHSAKYSNLHVDTINKNGFVPTLFIQKNDLFIKLNDLSEGEKIIILLVSDIAKRLAITSKLDAKTTLEKDGIVLIDEIETHLHPAWQRDIIPALTHVFPNVQFLVTTHSPQVLSNVKKESVHIIEDFKRVPFTPSIYGADSNYILNKIFGIRKQPKHSEEKFSEFYHALKDEKREEALALLKKLEELYGNRLDVQKARTSFEFEFDEYVPEV